MTIHHYTNKNITQLLATNSRKADITPYQLSQTHIEIGKFMAYQILDEFELIDIEINHPQGVKTGKQIKNETDIIILTFMRAGVYFSDGFRFVFQNAPFYYISPKRGVGILEAELNKFPSFEKKTIILTDSVINTGGTMFAVIEQIKKNKPLKIIVTCSVMPDTTVDIIKEKYPKIEFYIFRISSNKYVGKGKIDTGNRLFGTY